MVSKMLRVSFEINISQVDEGFVGRGRVFPMRRI
jgi:hypothetical protein